MTRILAETRDQAAHALASALILAPVAFLHPAWWSCALSGALVGLVRETGQHRTFRVWTLPARSWLDVTFWGVGGLALALVR